MEYQVSPDGAGCQFPTQPKRAHPCTRQYLFQQPKGAGLAFYFKRYFVLYINIFLIIFYRYFLNYQVSPLGDHTFFQQPKKVGEKARFQTKSNTSLNSYFCLQKKG